MQHRSVFVKRHNVAIRYVGITMTGPDDSNADIDPLMQNGTLLLPRDDR